jgi:hypothetical protein
LTSVALQFGRHDDAGGEPETATCHLAGRLMHAVEAASVIVGVASLAAAVAAALALAGLEKFGRTVGPRRKYPAYRYHPFPGRSRGLCVSVA